jgi:hypothetical protein
MRVEVWEFSFDSIEASKTYSFIKTRSNSSEPTDQPLNSLMIGLRCIRIPNKSFYVDAIQRGLTRMWAMSQTLTLELRMEFTFIM